MRLLRFGFPLTFVLGIALAAGSSPASAQTVEWTIDSAHTAAQFAVRHMMVSTVRGRLGKATGTVRFDGKHPASIAVEATIDVAGVDTQESRRDDDLRGPNFFDAQKFPTITFRSKRAEASGAGKFRLIGDLTLHGTTKEVVLDVEGPSPEIRQGTMRRIGATATTKINRSDFGLTWNRAIETGGVVVGDEVAVTIDLELVRKADTAVGTK